MKKVEQIAAEIYPNRVDAALFLNGYDYARQSQPMWREIEADKLYRRVLVRNPDNGYEYIESDMGYDITDRYYTHYLASEDLLKLPVESKPLQQVTVEDDSELLPNPFKIGDKVELINDYSKWKWVGLDNLAAGVEYTVTDIYGRGRNQKVPAIKVSGGEAKGTYWIASEEFKLVQ